MSIFRYNPHPEVKIENTKLCLRNMREPCTKTKQKAHNINGYHYLKSSNDLIADTLIIRTAGLPGSTFPSSSFFSHSTCLHDDPKPNFTRSARLALLFPTEAGFTSTMQVSAY